MPCAASRVDVPRESQQCHLVFGSDAVSSRDPRRYVFSIISTVFGGGMSSRLFQKVREELGLAYAVFSYQQFYQTAGITGVYVGTQSETADQAIEVVTRRSTRGSPRRACPARSWPEASSSSRARSCCRWRAR